LSIGVGGRGKRHDTYGESSARELSDFISHRCLPLSFDLLDLFNPIQQ
jgi:hypothetical protein